MATIEQIKSWKKLSSSQLKKQLKDHKGYSKEERKAIRIILKDRRSWIDNPTPFDD